LPPRSPAHSKGGQDQCAQEYDDPDEQQEQQALGDHADNAQDDRCDHQQQEQCNHRSSVSRRRSAAGGPSRRAAGVWDSTTNVAP
jgi:hypothetical protein